MTDRVLLDANGLKISKPGFDVNAANNQQLQFNSNWRNMEFLEGGIITLPRPLSTNGTWLYIYAFGFVSNKAGYKTSISFANGPYPTVPYLMFNIAQFGVTQPEANPLPSSMAMIHAWAEATKGSFYTEVYAREPTVSGFNVYAFGQTESGPSSSTDKQWWAGAKIGWTAWRV